LPITFSSGKAKIVAANFGSDMTAYPVPCPLSASYENFMLMPQYSIAPQRRVRVRDLI